jgi:hypothetical protein
VSDTLRVPLSYDLYLLPKQVAGDDPAAAYERLEENDPRPPTHAEEEHLRRLAADLQAASPGLDLTEPEQGFLLQLGYETERPVVIDISADEITMSWSYGADDSGPALAEVKVYLPVFDRHGYVAYDPQLERVFSPERDAGDAAEIHRDVRDQVFEQYGTPPAPRPPWWKRRLGRT